MSHQDQLPIKRANSLPKHPVLFKEERSPSAISPKSLKPSPKAYFFPDFFNFPALNKPSSPLTIQKVEKKFVRSLIKSPFRKKVPDLT